MINFYKLYSSDICCSEAVKHLGYVTQTVQLTASADA